jgi:Lrp/AsnC family leucine-responsive transcriptional regulator
MKKYNLDKTDLKILKILQETGKISNLKLSQDIGLSPAPTLERVKKLEQNGVIESYHAQLNDQELGLDFHAFIQVSLVRQWNIAGNTFLEKINAIEEVLEVYQVTGNYDYQMKVITKDIAAFEALIREKLSHIEEIAQMQTLVILRKVKDKKTLPLNYLEKE